MPRTDLHDRNPERGSTEHIGYKLKHKEGLHMEPNYQAIHADFEACEKSANEPATFDEPAIIASRGLTQAPLWKSAAESGLPRGQYLHGRWLSVDSEDQVAAARWYRSAADQGNAAAQVALGDVYYYGQGVPEDFAQGIFWYRQAAEQGYARAQNQLGYCYFVNSLTQGSTDLAESAVWYRRAAEQGNAEHQVDLARCYFHGTGVAQDFAQSFLWYRKVAEQGHVTAQNTLGYFYYHGKGIAQDFVKAVLWCRKAAEQADETAQNNLGHSYYDSKGVEQDFTQAVFWYRKAAEQGHAWAQVHLGSCYFYGKGAARDLAQAFVWYRRAYETERKIYDFGCDDDDFVEIAALFRKLAELGHANEPYNLSDGYCLIQDGWFRLSAGVEWYRKHAENGNADAGEAFKAP